MALKHYSFAYSLLPDELMATQLLIDTVTKIVVELRDEYELNIEGTEVEISSKELELKFLRNLYSLSTIRFEHFKNSAQLSHFDHSDKKAKKKSGLFFLDIKERAALVLKDKLGLSYKDVAYTLSLSYEETLALIHRIRPEFLDLCGEPNSKSVMKHGATYGY